MEAFFQICQEQNDMLQYLKTRKLEKIILLKNYKKV